MSIQGPLPYSVMQAAITVCRDAMYYRDDLRSMFLNAGVPRDLYDKYDEPTSPKAKIARSVPTDQMRVVSALCSLTKPLKDATDPEAGRRAIGQLREEVQGAALLVDPGEAASNARRAEAKRRAEAIAGRRERLGRLRATFLALHTSRLHRDGGVQTVVPPLVASRWVGASVV